jgi:hypothetical protein
VFIVLVPLQRRAFVGGHSGPGCRLQARSCRQRRCECSHSYQRFPRAGMRRLGKPIQSRCGHEPRKTHVMQSCHSRCGVFPASVAKIDGFQAAVLFVFSDMHSMSGLYSLAHPLRL